jgi:hypothetical protein
MNFGMMWFDNDPKTSLLTKVERAAEYYRTKYGHAPNLCLVNPGSMPEKIPAGSRISIRPQSIILPGHLWIGLDEKEN